MPEMSAAELEERWPTLVDMCLERCAEEPERRQPEDVGGYEVPDPALDLDYVHRILPSFTADLTSRRHIVM